MESIKYQEAHACFSVRLGFQPTPTHSPHLPVYTKAVSLSHLGNWWYPMCTLGGSRTARSVFFSWPIALWRPPYSFWLFFYNRKIQWCPFVFVCQAVLSGICLALEELGSALLPRWNNNTTSSSTAAPPTLKGAVLFFFFLVSAVFWLHAAAAAFGSPRRKASFQIYRLQSNEGDVVKRETTKKSCVYSLFFFFFFLSLPAVQTDSLMDKKMNVLFDTFPSGSSRFFFFVYFRHLDVSLLRFIFFFLIFWGFFFLSSSVAG